MADKCLVKNFPTLLAVQMEWAALAGKVPINQSSTAVLKSMMLAFVGLDFGFTVIHITYHLIRFNPLLQPEELFTDNYAPSVLI